MELSPIDIPAPAALNPSILMVGVELDRLAGVVAALTETDATVTAVWDTLVHMESALGVPLGAPDESLAMLWRRFARVDRELRARRVGDPARDHAIAAMSHLLGDLDMGRRRRHLSSGEVQAAGPSSTSRNGQRTPADEVRRHLDVRWNRVAVHREARST